MVKALNLKIDWLFWFILLMPTFYVFNTPLREIQANFFQVAVMVMVGLFCVNRYLGAFLVWSACSYIFINHDGYGLVTLQNTFFGILLYQFIVLYSRPSGYKKYLWALIGILLFNIAWTPLQIFDVDPVWRIVNLDKIQVMTEYQGWFALPAFLGNYVALVLPFILAMCVWLVPFALIGLWFSKSTFSVVAAVGATLFFFWFKKRILFWALLIILAVASAFYIRTDLKTGQFGRRLKCWHSTLHGAFQKQFFGNGIGMYGNNIMVVEVTPTHNTLLARHPIQLFEFIHNEAAESGKPQLADYIKEKVKDFQRGNPTVPMAEISNVFQKENMDVMVWKETHNDFIQTFFNLGLVGLGLIILYICNIFRRFWKVGTKSTVNVMFASSFLAIIIITMGHFPFQVARLAGPFIVVLAMYEGFLIQAEKQLEI